MNYLRNPDEFMGKLAHKQAYIFEKSSKDEIPSYFFIKVFMYLDVTKELDSLILVPDDEILFAVQRKLKNKRGKVLNSNEIHWMGYIYRVLSYLYDIESSKLFKLVNPKYLSQIYPLYHSLDPVKAASMIYEEKIQEKNSNLERMLMILRETI